MVHPLKGRLNKVRAVILFSQASLPVNVDTVLYMTD